MQASRYDVIVQDITVSAKVEMYYSYHDIFIIPKIY